MKVMWCVCSGPDQSHLLDVEWFARLRDAKQYAQTLPIAPSGQERPRKIERHEFEGDYK